MRDYHWEWTRQRTDSLRRTVHAEVVRSNPRIAGEMTDSQVREVQMVWGQFVDELTRYQRAGTEIELDFDGVFLFNVKFLSRILPQGAEQQESVVTSWRRIPYQELLRSQRYAGGVGTFAGSVVREVYSRMLDSLADRAVVSQEFLCG